MWMVFNAGSNGINNVPLLQYSGQSGYPTAALNGVLMLGQRTSGDNWGNLIVNFISEYIVRIDPQGGEGVYLMVKLHKEIIIRRLSVLRLNDSRFNAVATLCNQMHQLILQLVFLLQQSLLHMSAGGVIHDVNNGTVYDINTDASVGPSVDFIDGYNGTNIVCGWDTVGN